MDERKTKSIHNAKTEAVGGSDDDLMALLG
jgi:hypothetical protein